MHICFIKVGIAVEIAQDLEASAAWAFPLLTELRNADDFAGLKSISPGEVAAEFEALESRRVLRG